jgi:hypothetical protein
MALDFKVKDVMHRIIAKFFQAYLPTATKKYILRPVLQPELDIHGIASKASVYNITTSPKIIEEGMTAGMELIYYLSADGYKINTPVFLLKAATPGEYDGTETRLPDGRAAEGRITISPELRKYFAEHVEIQIDGIEENIGLIGESTDYTTGKSDIVTRGGILEIRGIGIKVAGDDKHTEDVGLYLEDAATNERIKFKTTDFAFNSPHDLRAIVPTGLTVDKNYYIVIRTQASVKSSSSLLKNIREIKSDYTLTAK